METTIKQLVKDAVLEALTEFANQGIALALNAEPTTDQSTYNKKETGKGGASEEYYGIQVMGLGRLLKDSDPALKGLKTQPVKADDSNIYKYVYGNFKTKDKAASELGSVRKKFPEAFVVKVSGTTVTRAK